jgi:hypothetical protein
MVTSAKAWADSAMRLKPEINKAEAIVLGFMVVPL